MIELDKDLYGPDNHLVEVSYILFVSVLTYVRKNKMFAMCLLLHSASAILIFQ